MDIQGIQSKQGADIYYSDALRAVFMDHMSFLRNHSSTYALDIEPNIALKFTGDLYGLLSAKNFNPDFHWVIMKLNAIDNPNQCDVNLSSLLIPPLSLVESIKNVFNSKKS